MRLRVAAISDIHGYFPTIEEPADILLIAGDISPLEIQFDKPKMKIWLETEFAYWVKNLPVERVFLIAGNHDLLENNKDRMDSITPMVQFLPDKDINYFK